MDLKKLEKQKKWQTENLAYRINEYTCNFKNVRKISTFGRDIYSFKIIVKEADKDQSSLLVEIIILRVK